MAALATEPVCPIRQRRTRLHAGILALSIGVAGSGWAAQPGERIARPQRSEAAAGVGAAVASGDVHRTLDWIARSGDNEGLAFAILDKRNARLFVFDASRRLRGSTPVLLGLAVGDHTVPGIGERELADIRPHERTTPAGRFVAEPGRNLQGEDIVWVDYDAAVSLHRVRTGNPRDRRLERLATPTVADNRISFGCVNVPAAFYNAELKPVFGAVRTVVYVLPESQSLEAVFPGLAAHDRTRGG